MKIKIAQFAPKVGNLKKVEKAAKGAKLLLLPEVWSTGFDWENEEKHFAAHKETMQALGEIAKGEKTWIIGSTLSDRKTNQLTVISPEGKQAAIYDKIHLFPPMIFEDEHLKPGKVPVTIDLPFGMVGLSVCYDIRFPELYRQYALAGCDLMIDVACMPMVVKEQMQILTRARAIENQCFFLYCNACGGTPPADLAGHSAIIDPFGNVLAEAGAKEEVIEATLDHSLIAASRERIHSIKHCKLIE